MPTWKKSTAAIVVAWAERNYIQLAAARCGAGSTPAALRIAQDVADRMGEALWG
ncbi:MAG TPA: hypothetical protein VII22_04135 [Streptosporangiaceae bacterium]